MTENNLHEGQVEKLDNSVPTFNPVIGDYQYEDGTNFECEILSWNKLSKEMGFRGLLIEEDGEE